MTALVAASFSPITVSHSMHQYRDRPAAEAERELLAACDEVLKRMGNSRMSARGLRFSQALERYREAKAL